MIRNIKALGLALVAIFAMSAVVASAASAQQGELTSDGPVKLDITELAGKENSLSAFGGVTTCTGSVLTGFKYNVTPHELIASGSTTATIIPDYNQATCKVVEGGTTHKATVTMNGCDYVLHIGTTVSGKFPLTADVVCPVGQKISVDVYAFAGSELGGVACTITVGSQGPLAGVSAATVAGSSPHDLVAEGTFTGISAEKSGFGCATESTTTGTFALNVTVEGTNAGGGATAITLTD